MALKAYICEAILTNIIKVNVKRDNNGLRFGTILITINGWDWLLQKVTFNINYWLKKIKK